MRIVLPQPTTTELKEIAGKNTIFRIENEDLFWQVEVPENIWLITDAHVYHIFSFVA